MPPIIFSIEFAGILQTRSLHKRHLLVLHGHMHQTGLDAHPLLGNQFFLMLVKHGNMSLAQQVFEQLLMPNASSWNSLIRGYVQHGESLHALKMYMKCQEHDPLCLDGFSFLSLLKACIELKDLNLGCYIHQHIVESGLLEVDVFLGSTLVDMYAKCGSMRKARDTFDKLQARDAITWTVLIAGYVENQQGEEAIDCVVQMQQDGVPPDAFTYSCSLKACGMASARGKGQKLHMGLTKVGLEHDIVVTSTIIDIYTKQGFVDEGFKVFDSLPNRTIVSWNALLTGLTEHGLSKKTLECLQQLLNEDILPDVVTFTCILKACGSLGTITLCEGMHTLVLKMGMENEVIVGNSLIDMYAKCGALATAQKVFDGLSAPSIVSWNALIGGFVEDGQGDEALKWLNQMECKGMSLDHITFCYGLKACGSVEDAQGVQKIHAAIIEKGVEKNLAMANTLVDMYAKCGMLVESQGVFDKVPTRDRASWNVLISGYTEQGNSEAALMYLENMQESNVPLDGVTFACCLKACGILGAVNKGYGVHAEVFGKGLEGDPFVVNSLLDMYVKCGLFAEAQTLFGKVQAQNILSWNVLIKGYIEFELYEESIDCLEKMQKEGISPDPVTCVCCLKACGNLRAVHKGRDLHNKIIKSGLDQDDFVGSTLIHMYSRWGLQVEARRVFGLFSVKTLFYWTALLAGYVEFGLAREVLDCLKQMEDDQHIRPDDVVFVCALKASASLGAVDKGMEIHRDILKQGLEQNCIVSSTLVFMYGKCGFLLEAQKLFDRLETRNVVSWTAMIAGYLEHGYGQEALDCLQRMQHGSCCADSTLLSYGLKACSMLGNTDKGQDICSHIFKKGLEKYLVIGSAVVDMYVKYGLMLEARRVFDGLSVREEPSWTALITGYAQLGESEGVFRAFHRMVREGFCPNSVTFLSVLNLCSHAGLLDHGEAYFNTMDKHYEITPMREHYNCLLDLFARASNLDKAIMMVNMMPFHPSIVVWQTMLGACRKWKDIELCMQVFEYIVQMD